jgi:carboxypeptidase family protein/TonB-dependent receptor-like protein
MRLWPKLSRFAVSCLIATALSFFNRITAQTTTSGALSGVVTDQTNVVVPAANVEVKDTAKGTEQSTRTDRDGRYQFFFLAPGKYLLIVSHDGFREERRTVEVPLGPAITVSVELQIARASSEIKVIGEAPLIKAENGDVFETINQQQISEMPNQGNSLDNIVQIAPGVLMNTQSSSYPFSILGMPGTSYLVTIDGISNTEVGFHQQTAGPLFLFLGQNQVEEATVMSTGYSGQFGGAAGGNINYSTKSGTTQFHGNAQYYWNGRILNANEWFLKALGLPRPFDVANQWAVSLGGPIKKAKFFFFFDNEGLRVTVPQVSYVQAPSPEFEAATLSHIRSLFGINSASDKFYQQVFLLYNAAPGANTAIPFTSQEGFGCSGFQDKNTGLGFSVPCGMHFLNTRSRPSQDTLTVGRVDWNISSRDRAFLRVQYENGHAAEHIDPISPIFDSDQAAPTWQGQVVETHSLGSSGASQLLVAGSSYFYTTRMLKPQESLAALPTALCFCGQGTFNTLRDGDASNPLGVIYGVPLQYQIFEDVMKTWRRYKFGFGGNFESVHWDQWQFSFFSIGSVEPQTLDAFYQGGVDRSSSGTDFTGLFQSFPSKLSARIAFHNFGIYGQDEWHAREDLSVSFALRAEHQSNPSCDPGCFVRMNGPWASVNHDPNQPYNQALLVNQEHAWIKVDRILWSPRLSLAWQPFGISHGTVLRGGIGVFHDSVLGGPALSFFGNPPVVNGYAVFNDNLAPGERPSNLFADAAASNTTFVNGFHAGQTLAEIKAIVASINPGGTSFSPPAITVPDRVMHAPQYQKWSLGLQQALGTHSTINVGYFGHHGIHQLVQNPSANAFGFGTLPAGRCPNPIPDCAPDPRFSGVTIISSPAISNYNGLVTSYQHRFSGWASGQFQLNYTFGHAFDEVSNGGLIDFGHGTANVAQDPRNLRRSYGPAEYDVRHSVNANYVWELPIKAALGGHVPRALVAGWQVAGTVFARTGFPYTVFDNLEAASLGQRNFFGPIYAVPVGPLGSDLSCGEGAAFTRPVRPCQIPQTTDGISPNPQARFLQTGCETGFDMGKLGASGVCDGMPVRFVQSKNRFRGPGYFNTDLTIMKNTKIRGWENASLGIGFQFFNLFNHPNFDLPNNFSGDHLFGQILGANGPPTNLMGNNTGGDNTRRLIQLRAELRF